MTLPLATSILRPLIVASFIGALFLSGIIWLSVRSSTARQDAADWTEHTVAVLRSIEELDVQIFNDADLRPLLDNIQRLTSDNDSQQRRLAPLLTGQLTKRQTQNVSVALRAEEHRLLTERVARWRNDARATDWLMFTLAGLISLLAVATIALVVRGVRQRGRKVELLAMNIDTAFSASPESGAYSEIQKLMQEIRNQVGGRKGQ